MLTCKDTTVLVSRQLDDKLALSERLGLTMHLAACRGCRQYRRQLWLIREACAKAPEKIVGKDV